MNETNNYKIEVFISYAHEDEKLRIELEKHLRLLERKNIISTWHDRKISSGSERKNEIDKHLRSSQVILLLISSDFVASDYCYCSEMDIAMELHYKDEAIVIPIMLRSVDGWKSSPLGKLEVLPENAVPITLWDNLDEAFSNVVKSIRERIQIFANKNSTRYEKRIVSNISEKYSRNINFEGRQSVLDNIRESLIYGKSTVMIKAIVGLGGIGKTQLAIEYAYRFREKYKIIWWINSESQTLLTNDYLDLGRMLGYKDRNLDRESVFKVTKEYLQNNDNWLLIFDNAVKVVDLFKYIPQMSKGHIIITSRNPNWSEIGEEIVIDVFEREEAIKFLLKRSGLEEKESAGKLVDELGCLPLALEQAASYIKTKGKTIIAYLKLFNKYQIKLFEKSAKPLSYTETVATTWKISFENISNTIPEALSLLNILAFLYASDIPVNLIKKRVEILPEVLKDELIFDNAIEELLKYSLISITKNNISIHRLVQSVIRSELSEEQQKKWLDTGFNILKNELIFNVEDKVQRFKVAKLIPHAQEILKYLNKYKIISNDLVKFVINLNIYFYESAMYNDCLTYLEEILDKSKGVSEVDEGYIVMLKKNIGEIYIILNKYECAIKYLEEALSMERRHDNERQNNIEASILTSIGIAYERLDKIKISLEYVSKAYELIRIQSDKNNQQILLIKYHLALILYRNGEILNSFDIFEEILNTKKVEKIIQKQYYADVLANYSFLLGDNTKLKKEKDKSIKLIEKALTIDREIYIKDHPKIARDLNNYAYLLDNFGMYEEAEPKFKEAININRKIFRNNNIEIGILLSNYGMNLINLKKYEEAEKMLNEAIEMNKSLGACSQVAIDYSKIGRLYFEVDKKEKGIKYLKKALEIDKSIYGDNHNEIITDLSILIVYLEKYKINKEEVNKYKKELFKIYGINNNFI